jgi:hypothetical protein
MMEMLLGEDFTELLENFPDIMQHVMKIAARRTKREAFSIATFQQTNKKVGGTTAWSQSPSKDAKTDQDIDEIVGAVGNGTGIVHAIVRSCTVAHCSIQTEQTTQTKNPRQVRKLRTDN